MLTNLNMNQPGLNLGSDNSEERRRTIDEYKRNMGTGFYGYPSIMGSNRSPSASESVIIGVVASLSLCIASRC